MCSLGQMLSMSNPLDTNKVFDKPFPNQYYYSLLQAYLSAFVVLWYFVIKSRIQVERAPLVWFLHRCLRRILRVFKRESIYYLSIEHNFHYKMIRAQRMLCTLIMEHEHKTLFEQQRWPTWKAQIINKEQEPCWSSSCAIIVHYEWQKIACSSATWFLARTNTFSEQSKWSLLQNSPSGENKLKTSSNDVVLHHCCQQSIFWLSNCDK